MKQLWIALFAAVVGLGLAAGDADAARRLGGGTSSGLQRNQVMQRQAAPQSPSAPTQSAAPAQPAPQPAGASRWLGPLAGLAAGIGLAALLSQFGLGEGFASVLMVLLLVFAAMFVFRLLLRRREPQPLGYAGAGGPNVTRFEPVTTPPGGTAPAAAKVPAGFDAEGFLRQAKLNFVRLQAANDAKNIEDIRNFTTPEMFAEIKLQMQERGDAPQQTDVVTLNAELLDLSEENAQHIASVRFSGSIREEENAPPQPFDEVWHLTKPTDGSRGWVIAGIQQYS